MDPGGTVRPLRGYTPPPGRLGPLGRRPWVEVEDGSRNQCGWPWALGQPRPSPRQAGPRLQQPTLDGALGPEPAGKGARPSTGQWPRPPSRVPHGAPSRAGAGRPPEGPCRPLPTAHLCTSPCCSGLSGGRAHTSLLRGDTGQPEGAQGGHVTLERAAEPPARGTRGRRHHATAELPSGARFGAERPAASGVQNPPPLPTPSQVPALCHLVLHADSHGPAREVLSGQQWE